MSQHSLSPHSFLPSLARPTRRAALASALLLPLAACSSNPSDGSGTGGTASDGSGTSAEGLTLVDPWVKAAEEGMTSAFGTLTNATGRDLQLIAASTPSAGMVELHETMGDGSGGMSMQEKEGGFPVPDGGELVLEPGGNHLMLMDLAAPLQPGDEVELTLQCEDGTELVVTATVKDFAGAQEHYEPEGSSGSGASDGGGEHDGQDADAHDADGHGDHGADQHGEGDAEDGAE